MDAFPFRLLLITDEDACRRRGRSVVETVALALSAGGDGVAVLLRDKTGSAAAIEDSARALKRVTDEAGAKLLVHTHIDVARRVKAFGAHLADGVPAPDARGTGSELLLGASRHASTVRGDDERRSIDYVMLAPVFAPFSKPDDQRPPLGTEGLAALCRESPVPVVALGGIDAGNASACLHAGARAVAVLGAVMAAEDPRGALASLLAAVVEAA